jgi:hypothetical protein
MYKRIGGLDYITIPNADYVNILGGSVYAKQQLEYDRCYHRIVDNTKILELSGLSQNELMTLENGIRKEFEALTDEDLAYIGCNEEVNLHMDEYIDKLSK